MIFHISLEFAMRIVIVAMVTFIVILLFIVIFPSVPSEFSIYAFHLQKTETWSLQIIIYFDVEENP
jgi:hypothetical protein